MSQASKQSIWDVLDEAPPPAAPGAGESSIWDVLEASPVPTTPPPSTPAAPEQNIWDIMEKPAPSSIVPALAKQTAPSMVLPEHRAPQEQQGYFPETIGKMRRVAKPLIERSMRAAGTPTGVPLQTVDMARRLLKGTRYGEVMEPGFAATERMAQRYTEATVPLGLYKPEVQESGMPLLDTVADFAGSSAGGVASLLATSPVVATQLAKVPAYVNLLAKAKAGSKLATVAAGMVQQIATFTAHGQAMEDFDATLTQRLGGAGRSARDGALFTAANALRMLGAPGKVLEPIAIFGLGAGLAGKDATLTERLVNGTTLLLYHFGGQAMAGKKAQGILQQAGISAPDAQKAVSIALKTAPESLKTAGKAPAQPMTVQELKEALQRNLARVEVERAKRAVPAAQPPAPAAPAQPPPPPVSEVRQVPETVSPPASKPEQVSPVAETRPVATAAETRPAPTATTPPAGTTTFGVGADAAKAGGIIPVGTRVKLAKSPRTGEIVEVLPQTPVEASLGEQAYRVKVGKEVGTYTVTPEYADISPVAATGGKKLMPVTATTEMLDARLREVGLEPSVFKNRKDKRMAIKRAEAKGAPPSQLAKPDGAQQRVFTSTVTANHSVSAAAVDAYGLKLPSGYVRKGDRYVFKGETTPVTSTKSPELMTSEKRQARAEQLGVTHYGRKGGNQWEVAYLVPETDVDTLAREMPDASVVVKDVNGHRAHFSLKSFAQLRKNQGFDERIREVSFDPSANKQPDNVPEGFMGGIFTKGKLLSEGEVPILSVEPIPGVSLRNNAAVRRDRMNAFQEAVADPTVRTLLQAFRVKSVDIEAPYKFDLSEQGHITKDGKTIRLNADASDPKKTLMHELGHRVSERLDKSDRMLLIEQAKSGKYPELSGYSRLGEHEEVIAEAFARGIITRSGDRYVFKGDAKPVASAKPPVRETQASKARAGFLAMPEADRAERVINSLRAFRGRMGTNLGLGEQGAEIARTTQADASARSIINDSLDIELKRLRNTLGKRVIDPRARKAAIKNVLNDVQSVFDFQMTPEEYAAKYKLGPKTAGMQALRDNLEQRRADAVLVAAQLTKEGKFQLAEQVLANDTYQRTSYLAHIMGGGYEPKPEARRAALITLAVETQKRINKLADRATKAAQVTGIDMERYLLTGDTAELDNITPVGSARTGGKPELWKARKRQQIESIRESYKTLDRLVQSVTQGPEGVALERNKAAILDAAEAQVDLMLRRQTGGGAGGGGISEAVSPMRRKHLEDQVIKALYGEVTDPLERMALTHEAHAKLLTVLTFRNRIFQEAKNSLWSEQPSRMLRTTEELPNDPIRFGSLAGKFVTPEIKAQLGMGIDSTWAMRNYLKVARFQRGAALATPGSLIRDGIGGSAFAAMNEPVESRTYRKAAAKATAQMIGWARGTPEAKREQARLVGQRYWDDADNSAASAIADAQQRGVVATKNLWQKIMRIRGAADYFYKVTSAYDKEARGWTPEAIRKHLGDSYPTHERLPGWVRAASRLPIIEDFPAFLYHSTRILSLAAKKSALEAARGNMVPLLRFTAAVGASVAMSSWASRGKDKENVTTEESDNLRKYLLPEFWKDSPLRTAWKRGADGQKVLEYTPFDNISPFPVVSMLQGILQRGDLKTGQIPAEFVREFAGRVFGLGMFGDTVVEALTGEPFGATYDKLGLFDAAEAAGTYPSKAARIAVGSLGAAGGQIVGGQTFRRARAVTRGRMTPGAAAVSLVAPIRTFTMTREQALDAFSAKMRGYEKTLALTKQDIRAIERGRANLIATDPAAAQKRLAVLAEVQQGVNGFRQIARGWDISDGDIAAALNRSLSQVTTADEKRQVMGGKYTMPKRPRQPKQVRR